MAHKTARVEQDTLVSGTAAAGPIVVGTPAWFAWLESATTFAFSGPGGSFTARKEGRDRGGWYWKAYRTVHGTLQRVYLGKSADLTLARLNEAAATLAAPRARPARRNHPPQLCQPQRPTCSPPNSSSRPPAPRWCPARACSSGCRAGLRGKLTAGRGPGRLRQDDAAERLARHGRGQRRALGLGVARRGGQ